jgi:phosphoglycerol transferase MdoB-like AlkP superfamily enzyme
MNYFFSHNGYKVVDLASQPDEAVSFQTIWGACDENLYDWVLDEADRSYEQGRPFHQFVMTTSNHRPYTYPSGRIDIPSGASRRGAVKYTDFAIGEFIRKAETKPWFVDTLFVIVADHGASSAGKDELPIEKYRIPLIVYNPKLIAPARIDKLCSQIDVPPTLLALMGWSYESRFYGQDILRMEIGEERALIAS